MTTAVFLRSGMTRKCHVPFCRAVGGVTRLLTLIQRKDKQAAKKQAGA